MRFLIFVVLILAIFSCGKKEDPTPDNTVAENVSLQVKPSQTDANYATTDENHYVVRNTKLHLNKLLLFIGGSFSAPKDYVDVCGYGATIGLDVISLSYPNDVATAPLGASSDPLIFNQYREEICFGNPVSSVVDVDVLNCVVTRATKLIQYLAAAYPDQNWNQYLTANSNLRWDRIILSGHSQGSGHACYLGKKFLADRVVMFSGPNDFHTFYNKAGDWLSQNGLTPVNKYFSLLHTQDEIVSFSSQVANIRALGVLGTTDIPLLVDDLAAPFFNANCMSLNISSLSNHASTIGKNSKLPAIWTYMFTKQ